VSTPVFGWPDRPALRMYAPFALALARATRHRWSLARASGSTRGSPLPMTSAD
jgi:hypothetical protein